MERDAEKAPPVIEDFVRHLLVANKAVQLYPAASSIPRQSAASAVAALVEALETLPEITLAVTRQALYFAGTPLFEGQPAFTAFAQDLYNHRLALVRFHAGVTADDVIVFLSVLANAPEEVVAAGGYEAMLWEQGVGAITVVEAQVTLVDQTEDNDDRDSDAPEAPTVSVRREASAAPRTSARIELMRVIADRRRVQDYLTQRYDDDGHEIGLLEMQRRFTELARMAAESSGAERDALLRMFADALWSLDPDMRRELLGDGLIPAARSSSALTSALNRIDLEEIIRLLAEGEGSLDARRAGFVRALKNLAQINQIERDRVAQVAAAVLSNNGVSEGEARAVIAEAAPRRLKVRRGPHAPRLADSAAATVLALIDQAQLSRTRDAADDPELAALQDEAALGVSEGDIISTLVSLAGMDSREAQFASVMSALEDSLDMLVSRGEIETAADAAISLVNAAENPALTPEQTRRLESAITRFARPGDIRGITHALRIYEPGQPEYDAAQRLLGALGALAIRPMLEQLATEQDRQERKALVDLISRDASRYTFELGAHVTDPRWYFVRNVVAILGSTKSPDALGPLERTLSHTDLRVRRETIRALSGISDRRAENLLIAALGDEDAQNVQLAARYLGLRGLKVAIPALEAVARGEGRGSRDTGPRVEAVEALGRMGAREALPTLEAIARKRSIIGGSRTRELRTAANSAIAAIQAKGGGQ